MSSLIFFTDVDQAFVATDTLAVRPDGSPVLFTSKALICPHLRMVMAGTGLLGMSTKWFAQINDHMAVKGIDNLDFHTPDALNSLWDSLQSDLDGAEGITTTIYHFGFSEETGEIHSYAYRSEKDFESERLPHGVAVKPECAVPDGWEFPADIRSLMEEQRKIQRKQPSGERIYIGGEIQAIHLTKHGTSVNMIDQFDDHEDMLEAAFLNHWIDNR